MRSTVSSVECKKIRDAISEEISKRVEELDAVVYAITVEFSGIDVSPKGLGVNRDSSLDRKIRYVQHMTGRFWQRLLKYLLGSNYNRACHRGMHPTMFAFHGEPGDGGWFRTARYNNSRLGSHAHLILLVPRSMLSVYRHVGTRREMMRVLITFAARKACRDALVSSRTEYVYDLGGWVKFCSKGLEHRQLISRVHPQELFFGFAPPSLNRQKALAISSH